MYRSLLSAIATASSHKQLGNEYISTEHLLVGLAADEQGGQNRAGRAGATPDTLLKVVSQIRQRRWSGPDPEETYKALEKYGLDLTSRPATGP